MVGGADSLGVAGEVLDIGRSSCAGHGNCSERERTIQSRQEADLKRESGARAYTVSQLKFCFEQYVISSLGEIWVSSINKC